MKRIKTLFLIHDLGRGGAEKVLVNLVNHMDQTKFDITVVSVFGGGDQEKRLAPHIHHHSIFKKLIPGNSKIMKCFTPAQLHKWLIRERYDIEIAYLEGPDSRIISGCEDKTTTLINWVHGEIGSRQVGASSFRNELEARACYNRFKVTVCVSKTVKKDFTSIFQINHACEVHYNTVEFEDILAKAREGVHEIEDDTVINLVAVGTLKEIKGFDRLLHVLKRLKEKGLLVRLYILGEGPDRGKLEKYIEDNQLNNSAVLLGYQSNPYKYVAKCDLFVCSSHREGFSTAATEALIVGTPVCTVDVSGMKEMLGENNEYGVVVPNDDDSLYEGIKRLIEDPDLLAHYRKQAENRGRMFSTESTVKSVENMLEKLYENGR